MRARRFRGMNQGPSDAIEGHAVEATSWRAVASTALISVIVMLPLLLVGSFSPLIRADLDITVSAVGLQISAFFLGVALTGTWLGSAVQRLGPRISVKLALAGTGAATFFIAGFARGTWALGLALFLAGASSALAQPAMAALLVGAVRTESQGIAFGIKQAAGPASSLVAGLALPLVALSLGWRWAFVILGTGAILTIPTLDRHRMWPSPPVVADRRSLRRAWLFILGVAFGAGVASTAPLTMFLVETLVERGISAGRAGWILAGGSLIAVVMRLVYGRLADRRRGRLMTLVATLMIVGSLGYAGIAHPSIPVTLIGVSVGFGVAWGWPGLLQLATVRLHPSEPARVTGIVSSSAAAGAVIGPIVFTAVADAAGFGAAWIVTAALSAVAGTLVLVARSLALREISDN